MTEQSFPTETARLQAEWRRRESNPRNVPHASELRFVKKGYAARRVLEQAIAARDHSWRCFYCGDFANTIDHVICRYRGGSDGIENLVHACWDCNVEKNTKPAWFFALTKAAKCLHPSFDPNPLCDGDGTHREARKHG